MNGLLTSRKANALLRYYQKKMPKVEDCQCSTCRIMCRHPCIGTPSEVEKLIKMGYRDCFEPYRPFIKDSSFAIWILRAKNSDKYVDNCGYPCVFFQEGKCIVHDNKPTEGKVVNHNTTGKNGSPYDKFRNALVNTWRTKKGERLIDRWSNEH